VRHDDVIVHRHVAEAQRLGLAAHRGEPVGLSGEAPGGEVDAEVEAAQNDALRMGSSVGPTVDGDSASSLPYIMRARRSGYGTPCALASAGPSSPWNATSVRAARSSASRSSGHHVADSGARRAAGRA